LTRGRHFDRAIIALCVRWYITDKLSYRDSVELMAGRGVEVSHTTILRWVCHHVPEFEKRWNRYARPVGASWRVDGTYIRVRGRRTYLYRAVDRQGLTVDLLPSVHRDTAAAKRFFHRAIERHGTPETITLDGYPATHAAVAELKQIGVLRPQAKVGTSKYLNNLIEQDHRRVKQRIYPTLGFKGFRNAAVTISGIEFVQQIKKGRFDIPKSVDAREARTPQLWEAVLAV